MNVRALSTSIGAILASSTAGANGLESIPYSQPPIHFVTNCDDHGPGSLRDVLASAASGDSIDLGQLTCGTITLTTGQLQTTLRDITLGGETTISAGGSGRVLSHLGDGTLSVFGLVFADGHVAEDHVAAGGCIESRGNIFAIGVTVRNCSVSSTPAFPGYAVGGGIFANGNVSLLNTSVVDNSSIPSNPGDTARGGGIYTAGSLYLSRSTVSGNAVTDNSPSADGTNAAGGFFARAGVYMSYSTVSGNSAHFAGGAWFGDSGSFGYESDSTIRNSTISGNSAMIVAGGLVTQDTLLKIWNSTIAFNHAIAAERAGIIPSCGGILAFGNNEYLSFRSSIVANNTAGLAECDLYGTASVAPVVGYGNLIVASNRPLPSDTLHTDPMLEPLANNGGPTLTHLLRYASPAIDAGNNSSYLKQDQRGVARVVGAQTDIGSVEAQPDTIFTSGFEGPSSNRAGRP